MSSNEEALVRSAVAGDSDALSELLRRFGPEVERTLKISPVWRTVLEPGDVMQVTYLEVFLRISTFESDRASSFAAWLHRIADNNLKDAIRGLSREKQPQPRQRVRPPRYADSLAGLQNLLSTESATPSKNLQQREMCDQLEQAIAALPDRYAEVIKAYDLEGQSIDEVARRVGRSRGAVHMLRARAHDRLRERLVSVSRLM